MTFFPLEQLPEIRDQDIRQIHGFGEITSTSIARGLAAAADTFTHMLALGFHLQKTPLADSLSPAQSPVAGQRVVFTGKMKSGSRDQMQEEARLLGARVQSAVSGKTDYLVCGEKVGRAKLEKAGRLGVTVLTEGEYRNLIAENLQPSADKGTGGGGP